LNKIEKLRHDIKDIIWDKVIVGPEEAKREFAGTVTKVANKVTNGLSKGRTGVGKSKGRKKTA
jgi:predicted GTPase